MAGSKLAFQALMFIIHSPQTAKGSKIFLKGELTFPERPGQVPLTKLSSIKAWWSNFKIQGKNTPKKVYE